MVLPRAASALISMSWPFCSQSRPTHTRSGAAARSERAPGGEKCSQLTPFSITTIFRAPAAERTESPSRASRGETVTMVSAHRAAIRSKWRYTTDARPPTYHDQAWGTKTHPGRCRRRRVEQAIRPTAPALLECKNTRSTSTRSRRSSRSDDRSCTVGSRVRSRRIHRIPADRAHCSSPPGGEAIATSWPWSRSAIATSCRTEAVPPSTG